MFLLFQESAEEYEIRCFLSSYRLLKFENGDLLTAPKLLKLLQQRFDLPNKIPEDEKFKNQLDKGQVCFGEFNRSYNNKYLQPVRRRVLKVLQQWVKDDPWKDMENKCENGLDLYERLRVETK